jgi:hypothetical protein
MLPPTLLLALLLHPIPQQAVVCENNLDAQTEPLRSVAGFTVILRMHSEDDHMKNSHLCESDYSFSGTDPDGKPIGPGSTQSGFDSIDEAWGRSIVFGIECFTSDGNRVVAIISEGSDPAVFEVVVYDLRVNLSAEIFDLPRRFIRRLGPECAATLHVSGTVSKDSIVLATAANDRCTHARSWRISAGAVVHERSKPSIPMPLQDGTVIVPLDFGTTPSPRSMH